jgi:hypothetical protein
MFAQQSRMIPLCFRSFSRLALRFGRRGGALAKAFQMPPESVIRTITWRVALDGEIGMIHRWPSRRIPKARVFWIGIRYSGFRGDNHGEWADWEARTHFRSARSAAVSRAIDI